MTPEAIIPGGGRSRRERENERESGFYGFREGSFRFLPGAGVSQRIAGPPVFFSGERGMFSEGAPEIKKPAAAGSFAGERDQLFMNFPAHSLDC